MEAEGSVLMTSAATPDSIKDDVQPPPATSLLETAADVAVVSAALWRSENQTYFFLYSFSLSLEYTK